MIHSVMAFAVGAYVSVCAVGFRYVGGPPDVKMLSISEGIAVRFYFYVVFSRVVKL